MNQTLALQISIHLMALIAVGFIYVALNARITAGIETFGFQARRWRRRLFLALLLAGIPIAWYTLEDLPFRGTASVVASETPPQIVSVVGGQWRWDIRPSTVTTGRTVVFQITSADVNHGFAIYDSAMRMVAQTQAMPGYVNKLRHRFDKPGRYAILCLEYCGLAHHAMRAEIIVTRAGQ